MNIDWIQKYALNLGWFLLLLGGVSLLDKGSWTQVGIVMMVAGMFNMINTLIYIYLGKQPFLLSPSAIYWVNIGGVVLLGIAHLFSANGRLQWELGCIWILSLAIFFAGKFRSRVLKQAGSKKKSDKR